MKRITVIGTGYVGLVSGAGMSDFGNDVSCVDIDKQKIDEANIKTLYSDKLIEISIPTK